MAICSARAGAYFITIVAKNRDCIFGEIADGEMRLNEYGEIVAECWSEIPNHYYDVVMDEFMVMPNHIHGIIIICEHVVITTATVGATQWVAPTKTDTHMGHGMRGGKITIASNSIGSMIGQFKSAVTKRINILRTTPGAPVW